MSENNESTESSSGYYGLSESLVQDSESPHFTEKINQIIKEKNELQKRYDELCMKYTAITPKDDEIASCKMEIREKEQIIEDLQYRLDISIQAKKDMEKERELLKQMNEEVCSKLIAAETTNTTKIQNIIYQNEKLQRDIEELQKDLNEGTIYTKKLEADQDKLMRACQLKFDAECNSLTDVFQLLDESISNKQNNNNENNVQMNVNDNNNGISDEQIVALLNKYKKFKRLSKESRSEIKSLEEEAINNEKIISSLKKQVDELESENNKIINENITISQENKQLNKQLLSIKYQNDSLQSQIEQFKTMKTNNSIQTPQLSIPSQTVQAPLVPQQVVQSQPRTTYDEEKENMKRKMNDLDESNKALKQEKEKLEDEIEKIKRQNADLTASIDELSSQIDISKKINDELQKTNTSLRNALTTRTEPKQVIKQPPTEVNNKNYNALKKKCNEQNNEISQLKSFMNSLESQVRQKDNKIRDMEKQILDKNSEISDLRKDLADAESKANNVPKSPEVFNELTFSDCVFEPNLAKEISAIVSHPVLQQQTKLRKIFQKIAQYTQNQHQEMLQALNDATEEKKKLEDAVNFFLLDISLAVSKSSVSISDINTERGQNFISLLKTLNAAYDNLTSENMKYKQIIESFPDVGLTKEVDINKWHNDFVRRINQTQIEAKKYKKSFNKCLKQCQIVGQQLEDCEREFAEEREQLSDRIKELEKKNDSLTKELNAAKNSLEDYKSEFAITKKYYEETQKQLEDNHKQTIEQMEKDANTNNNRNTEETEKLNMIINEYEQTIREQNNAINSLKDNLQSLENQNMKTEEEKEQLKKRIAQIQKECNEQKVREKENSKAKAEKIISELTKNLENNRKDIESLIMAQNELQQENNDLKEELSNIAYEKNKADSLVTNLREQVERQEKIYDASAKTATLSAETQIREKLEEERSTFEKEKKQLIANVFSCFSKFVDTTNRIDERSLRSLLQKVTLTLEKYEDLEFTLKRMLNVGERQTIQDAVAQLIMSVPESN